MQVRGDSCDIVRLPDILMAKSGKNFVKIRQLMFVCKIFV